VAFYAFRVGENVMLGKRKEIASFNTKKQKKKEKWTNLNLIFVKKIIWAVKI